MGKLIDLSGQRFGFWVAVKVVGKNKSNQTLWLCRCDCGTERNVTSNSLRTGNSTSCGCNHCPDLSNSVFGDLTVLEKDKNKNSGRRFWICKCSCDNKISVSTYQLRNNLILHCGCKNLELKMPKIEIDEGLPNQRQIETIQQNTTDIQQEIQNIIAFQFLLSKDFYDKIMVAGAPSYYEEIVQQVIKTRDALMNLKKFLMNGTGELFNNALPVKSNIEQ